MTGQQVMESWWRPPDHVNTTETADHKREQWVYDEGPRCATEIDVQHGRAQFRYFMDGWLVPTQTSRKD